jgi:aminobenzoyl-glutamate utilization protein B
MTPMKGTAWAWIEDNKERLIEISDEIWGYAELGLVEEKSAKLLADELESHGFKVERGVGGMPSAFYGVWGRGEPVIGIMGEFDALPGISNKAVPWKEPLKEGAPGHGCGHNIHGTSGLAAAIALRYALEEGGVQATVKFYGTPAEENYDGKVFMARTGIFDDVDACLSHHPGSMNTAGLGSSTAMNSVKFHYYGKTSHAAGSPEQGRSSLDAVELMNVGVNFMREHVIEKARIHYVIEEGGGQPNVVPDYARTWYYVRAPERDQVDHIYEWIQRIAEGAALMTGTRLEVDFLGGIYNKIPNKVLGDVVLANMREIGAPTYTGEELEFARKIGESVSRQQKMDTLRKREVPEWEKYMDVDLVTEILDPWNEGKTSGGSTDVADISWKTPTMEFGTTAFVLGTPGHSWQSVACSGMSIGHKSLIFAAKTLAGSALDLIADPSLIEKAKEEQVGRLKGQIYKSPIPDDLGPALKAAREAAKRLGGGE